MFKDNYENKVASFQQNYPTNAKIKDDNPSQ